MNTSVFQTVVFWVHRLVIASIAFLAASLLLGFFVGLAPALAALMTEARGWHDDRPSAYGTFGRVWRGAVSRWRGALPALVPVLILSLLAAVEATLRTNESAVLLAVGGAWSLMAVNHMALRLSFGLRAWERKHEASRFLALSWLHLVSLAGWAMLVALTGPVSPLLMPLFGPAALAAALSYATDARARAVLGVAEIGTVSQQ